SLRSFLQQGAGKGDLLAGLAYSIVENYINRVVCGRPVGKSVFFQGGTAFNKSVVAAFEKFLDTRITVPPHHDNTGAIGLALIARDHMREKGLSESSFKGFNLADSSYSVTSFECKGCENRCEINRVTIEGEEGKLFYGGRCEKYDIRQQKDHQLEDLFAFREEAQNRAHNECAESFVKSGKQAKRGVIGIPRVFFFQDFLPYFSTLLWELGFEVKVSPRTNPHVAGLGVQATLADTCYPVKASLGHITHLVNEGVDTIFLPSFVNMAQPGDPFHSGHACPLTQSFPYQAQAAFPQVKMVMPVVKFRRGVGYMRKQLGEHLASLGVSSGAISRALRKAEAAQQAFLDTIRSKGSEVLAKLDSQTSERTLVIVGRTYNAFDMGMNLEIPKKLATLNVQSIPMDFLPDVDIYEDWPEMYWRSGQRLLKAARFIREHPKLHGLFIGSFSCGPDSFIQRYFDQEIGDKPYLHIEIDEHSADAGVVTRCEAFLDSLEMQERLARDTDKKTKAEALVHHAFAAPTERKRRVYIPSMCDHAFALEAAFKVCGVEAEVLPECDDEAITLGLKHVSGKECYPFAVTTGDMLRKCFAPDFDPDHSAFFMPSGTGPCRFGQYNLLQRMVLDKAGLNQVPIFSPIQDVEFYEELGMVGSEFARRSWEGVVAFDLLTKCLHENRPYEKEKGSADALYEESLQAVRQALMAERNGDSPLKGLMTVMEKVSSDFDNLPKYKDKKPLVGIVGEIFVRSNRFSNEDVVRKVEELGGEAWLAPIDEWMYYVNWCSLKNARADRKWKKLLGVWIKNRIQTKIAHNMEGAFNGNLRTIHDPNTEAILKNASKYLDDTFRGEAVLSVGKTVDMIQRGAVGIINAMPFGCMPGTVVTSILRRISTEYGYPAISIPYDGTASP
ncbi:MAG: CoA protein activase, partial [Desulfovibrio sp.]